VAGGESGQKAKHLGTTNQELSGNHAVTLAVRRILAKGSFKEPSLQSKVRFRSNRGFGVLKPARNTLPEMKSAVFCTPTTTYEKDT
jgi:hypothetical protein